MFQMLGTALSVVSSIQEGRAKQEEAEFNRYQLQLKARQTKIEAAQRSNQRIADFNSARNNNEAFFAFLNRDPSDKSLKSFMAKQKDIAYKDANQITSQGFMEASQTLMAGKMETVKGQNALRAGYLGAASSVVSGIYRHQQTKV